MADPYLRYGVTSGAGSVPKTSFAGYLSSEPSSFTSSHLRSSNDFLGVSSDYLQKAVVPLQPGSYGVGDSTSIGTHHDTGRGGLIAGANIMSHPALLDPNLVSQRKDVVAGISPGIPNIINEKPNSLRMVDGISIPGVSNILFVDGLPHDCTRREVGHLFRPFIGFKEIRVIHKEPRRSGDKAKVLCFVEFIDTKCALTALEALQGYKFDNKKPDSPVLKIHFAHFPFHLPSDPSESRVGVPN